MAEPETGIGSNFSIGPVFEQSFSVFGRHFVQFAILAGIAMLPYLYIYWAQADLTFNQPPRFRRRSWPDSGARLA